MKPAYFLLLALILFSTCKKKKVDPTGSVSFIVYSDKYKTPSAGYILKVFTYHSSNQVDVASKSVGADGRVTFSNLKIDYYGVEIDSSNGMGPLTWISPSYNLATNPNMSSDTLWTY